MKTTIISIVAVVVTWGCSTTKSSISSEDLRQMKEQSEYLLTIDSSRCMPDLIRYRSMESCYTMARLNQKYKNYKIVFDSIYTDSFIVTPIINGMGSRENQYVVKDYTMRYRIYDGEQVLKTKIFFKFRRDTVTNALYCDVIAEGLGHRRAEPHNIDDDDD
jgi:hypothetical protein